ncbi:MAG: FAD binding domain-containing protein [Sphaerobacter sp.]|nr:FAD binding domain-containing protein [Sphaerobacter sp.]
MMSTEGARPRVVVVGGSLGGLTAALWLQDAGCDVEVFERVRTPLEDRGAGLVLHPATVRYLRARQGLDIEQLGAAANWIRYLGRDGRIAHQEPCRYRFTAYNVLYRALLRAIDPARYHLGEECTGFAQEGDAVVVSFASGRRERCDLLVCADGINSLGRRTLLPTVQPRYAGYVAWRGTVAEQELPPEVFATLHEAISYAVMPDSHILAYPIPDADGAVAPGHRLTNWLWYRNVPAGAALDDLLTTRTGERFGTSVPPGQVQERYLQQLRADARQLPPVFATLVARTASPFLQLIADVESPRMVFGRVCLIGDAAFTVRPHAAAGTAKAAEDGWTLAEAIRAHGGDVEAALAAWEPGQLALGRQLVARARAAGERLQHGRWEVGTPLPFGLYTVGDSALDSAGA